ncbi:MAG: MerR family transcriptional regulator [Gammaproteobacteria bacterium]|nr:MerR family transcriptional regulator [Gammaproteobacteria bacterium]MBI5619145.1 MerR family transcriptional regulator [Gammaproteobacteria bacterium]
MKMRELEARTGVNRETIRVYLRVGLLPEPARPKPNVADYGEAHVAAIQAVQRLQRDYRLPLAQIKRVLEGDAAAMPQGAGSLAHLDRLVAAKLDVDDALVPLSAIARRNPQAAADARALERAGAITLRRRGGERVLSRADAQIVGLWGDMRAGGFTEALGFVPELVGIYVAAARGLAHSEIHNFLAIVSGRLAEGPAADMVQHALAVMLELFGALRMKAVLEELRTQVAPAGRPVAKKTPRAPAKARGTVPAVSRRGGAGQRARRA